MKKYIKNNSVSVMFKQNVNAGKTQLKMCKEYITYTQVNINKM